MRRVNLLINCACRAVEREGRGDCVGCAVPGAVEAESGVASPGGNVLPCLTGLFADRHVGAALRYSSIPRASDGLSVGKSPRQHPVAQSGCSAVLDGDVRSELARVLRADCVVDRASRADHRSCDIEGE